MKTEKERERDRESERMRGERRDKKTALKRKWRGIERRTKEWRRKVLNLK